MSLSHLQPGLEFFTEVILQLKKKKANISNLLINTNVHEMCSHLSLTLRWNNLLIITF